MYEERKEKSIAMAYETLILEKKGKIAHLTLNRPEKLNSVNLKMFDEIVEVVDEIEKDDDILVLIIKGAGRSFCAGADLEMVYFIYGGGTGKTNERPPSQRDRLHMDRRLLEPFRRLLYCWKPTIAQVHGHAIGLGMYLIEVCDIAIAAEDAKIGQPDQRLAFGGSSFLLIKQFLSMGTKKARELLLTGRLVDGNEATQIGIANKAVPVDRLEAEVERHAKAISYVPRDAIAIGKMHTFLAYDTLGFSSAITQANMAHTLATNIRFEKDEFSFLKRRRGAGARQAFHERDARWKDLGF